MKEKKKRGCLIPTLIILALFVGLMIVIIQGASSSMKNKSEQTMSGKYIELTEEQSKNLDEVLKSCGIESVKNIEHDELLDNAHSADETGYRITISDSIDNIILYLDADKNVYSIRYADYDLYTNGESLATIDDYTVSLDELNKYQYSCQETVKSVLKSPNTAKFPNYTEWGWKQEKNLFYVQGYVDAQNGFGAEIRSTFQFIIDMNTDTIQSFIFDGTEMINQ